MRPSPPGLNVGPLQCARWASPLPISLRYLPCVSDGGIRHSRISKMRGAARHTALVDFGHTQRHDQLVSTEITIASRDPSSRRRTYQVLYAAGEQCQEAALPHDDNDGDDDEKNDNLSGTEGKLTSAAASSAALPRTDSERPPTTAPLQTAAAGTLQDNQEEDSAPERKGDEEESGIDWDKAWASTRKSMEQIAEQEKQVKKAAPPFSGRKQIIANRRDDGSYDFTEVAADGSRRTKSANGTDRRGGGGTGGFGFAGEGGDSVRDKIREKEQDAVDMATTDKVCPAG